MRDIEIVNVVDCTTVRVSQTTRWRWLWYTHLPASARRRKCAVHIGGAAFSSWSAMSFCVYLWPISAWIIHATYRRYAIEWRAERHADGEHTTTGTTPTHPFFYCFMDPNRALLDWNVETLCLVWRIRLIKLYGSNTTYVTQLYCNKYLHCCPTWNGHSCTDSVRDILVIHIDEIYGLQCIVWQYRTSTIHRQCAHLKGRVQFMPRFLCSNEYAEDYREWREKPRGTEQARAQMRQFSLAPLLFPDGASTSCGLEDRGVCCGNDGAKSLICRRCVLICWGLCSSRFCPYT